MKPWPLRLTATVLACSALLECRQTAPSSLGAASGSEIAGQQTADGNALACDNKNIFWRFLRTGSVECKQKVILDFREGATGTPLIGALYQLMLDIYIKVPIKQFFSAANSPRRTVELPEQISFVRAQLADDPTNKKPLYGVAKVIPKVTYSLSGLCDVKIQDFSIKVTAVEAPALGLFAQRAGPITEQMIAHYKETIISTIQRQLDAAGHSQLCWAYRKVFYRDGTTPALESVAPRGSEREAAERLLSGGPGPAEADRSEVDTWNAEKYLEFEKRWACAWAGNCP